jgi:hypothetical protein
MISRHKVQLIGLATILFTSAAASAQYGRDNGARDMVESSRQTGGYCDRSGCPDRFWRYRIYYGPVYYHGRWFRGPVYVKDDYGRNLFWVDGGWHRDEWRGTRPIWARNGHFGPALSRDYYEANNFGGRYRDADRRSEDLRDSQGYRENQPQGGPPTSGDSRRYGRDDAGSRNNAYTPDRQAYGAGGENRSARNDSYMQERQGYGARDDRGGYVPQDSRQARDQLQGGGGYTRDQLAQDDNRQNAPGSRNNTDSRSANGGPSSFTNQMPNFRGGRGQPGAQAQNQQTAISVTSATYGGSCKAPKGNVTQALQTACNGKASCQYTVSDSVLGDPAHGCQSDFLVEWTCGTGPGSSASLPAEANGNKVNLVCPTSTR